MDASRRVISDISGPSVIIISPHIHSLTSGLTGAQAVFLRILVKPDVIEIMYQIDSSFS